MLKTYLPNNASPYVNDVVVKSDREKSITKEVLPRVREAVLNYI